MRNIPYIAVAFLLLTFGTNANAQLPGAKDAKKETPIKPDPNITFPEYIRSVNALTQTVLRDHEKDNRTEAYDTLFNTLHAALMMPEADTCAFQYQLEGISVQNAPDGEFSIFTWQLFADDSTYIYGGLMRMKNGTIFRLTDKAREHRQPFNVRLRHTDWYGALYYRIMPFRHEGKDMYLLLGFNAHGFYTRRKLIDVLYFENDKPRFGYNVLQMKDGRGKIQGVQRFIMEYSASVTVSLNYSEADKMIVYDHLIYGAPIEGGGSTNVPDGSYCGLRLEKGKWIYVDKLHNDEINPNTTWDNPTAPMVEKPLFDRKNAKKTNIFGRERRR